MDVCFHIAVDSISHQTMQVTCMYWLVN